MRITVMIRRFFLDKQKFWGSSNIGHTQEKSEVCKHLIQCPQHYIDINNLEILGSENEVQDC